ncbi:MAG TPA: TA system VapC family ribonuclease toxin, partial [Actinomycetes bacterium]|nr:TA system VapC family ribonuclease toxin [Actinomycetes bacterium]
VDVNLLLYAANAGSPFHSRASAWLSDQLNGSRRVGLPWHCLVSFLRISTHPRAYRSPLTAAEAVAQVNRWLATSVSWIPEPGPGHADLLANLITKYDLRGNLIPDAHLAALALEHGLTLYSADSDFARIPELTWVNPVA